MHNLTQMRPPQPLRHLQAQVQTEVFRFKFIKMNVSELVQFEFVLPILAIVLDNEVAVVAEDLELPSLGEGDRILVLVFWDCELSFLVPVEPVDNHRN
jgi:hypothetical protein